MNKTIANLTKKIAKTNFINPKISTTDKMYLVISNGHCIDGETLRANGNYSSAICQKVCNALDVSDDESGSVCDWVMEGDYNDRPTLASVVRECKSAYSE